MEGAGSEEQQDKQQRRDMLLAVITKLFSFCIIVSQTCAFLSPNAKCISWTRSKFHMIVYSLEHDAISYLLEDLQRPPVTDSRQQQQHF